MVALNTGPVFCCLPPRFLPPLLLAAAIPPNHPSTVPASPWTETMAATQQRMHTGTASVSPPSRTSVQEDSEVKPL